MVKAGYPIDRSVEVLQIRDLFAPVVHGLDVGENSVAAPVANRALSKTNQPSQKVSLLHHRCAW